VVVGDCVNRDSRVFRGLTAKHKLGWTQGVFVDGGFCFFFPSATVTKEPFALLMTFLFVVVAFYF